MWIQYPGLAAKQPETEENGHFQHFLFYRGQIRILLKKRHKTENILCQKYFMRYDFQRNLIPSRMVLEYFNNSLYFKS